MLKAECEYCIKKPAINRKGLMFAEASDYKVFINRLNFLEDNVVGGSIPNSVYGIRINFCPMCGRDLNK